MLSTADHRARLEVFNLLDLGYRPVPVNARTKRPLVPWGQLSELGYRPGIGEALNNGRAGTWGSLIFEWSEDFPGCGWAILTEPSRLVVLDIDVKYGGHLSLRALVARHRLPRTYTIKTRSGGLHLYYRSATLVTSRATPWRGIEVKSVRGMVTSPPTPDYHRVPGYPAQPVLAPAWLVDRLSGTGARVVVPATVMAPDTPEAKACLAEAVTRMRRAPEGDRHRSVYLASLHTFLKVQDSGALESYLTAEAVQVLGVRRTKEAQDTVRDARRDAWRRRHAAS